MKTSTKALGGLAAVALAGAVLITTRPPPGPQPRGAKSEPDAGVLVRFESPCFREARHDPACRELLRAFPDGGVR